MKYELIVRPEPFSWPAEVDGYESFETEAFGQWQGETRRDGPNDIRWVQNSLNRLMNLRLPVSGIMDAAARSAWRSFQEKRGLAADGVLGPGTKRALAEAPTYPGEAEAFPASRLPARARAALTQGALAKKTSFRYVKDFSGPASECAEALKRAGKTRTEALSIINAQIGVAIVMLRKSATALKRGSRSDKTKTLFQKIFKVKPEFVPAWLKPTATIKDRGDVVATRCKRVAELLASGTIKFFCTINSTNCPDCSNDPRKFACSSYGDESKAPKNSRVVCLGDLFWDDMKAGKTDSLLATLMHEPFHIYYGVYVTEHRSDAGKFGGIDCIVQLAFETNGRAAPERVHERCTNMVVRKEVGGVLSARPEPFPWPTESEWEGEASRTGPEYIRWVQSSLNRVMGLRLAVDGIIGTMTRSAIRSFQSQKGLAVDGIVGPITEAALLKAGAAPPPGSAAPGIVVPQPIPWGPPSSTSSLRNAIVQTALQERQRWRNGTLNERDEAAFNILVDYWKNSGVGLSDSDARSYADRRVHWSAAFISWVMVKSGALPHFKPSTYHSTYIAAAYQNQLQRSRNPIKAYTVRQAAPRPGDLVCGTYTDKDVPRPPTDLPLVRPQTPGYHCDIVVQAAPGQLTTMGGNLRDTVGMNVLSIDPNGLVTEPGYFAVIRVG